MSKSLPGVVLLPNLLSTEATFRPQFAEFLREEILTLDGIFVESPKGAKNFMSIFKEDKLNKLTRSYLSVNTESGDIDFFLEPLLEGQKWGVISDAGLPLIADPGAKFVLRCHKKGIPVRAFGSTCSITAALMLSGLGAQPFIFHGYLPRDEKPRVKALKMMAKEITHVFIESPHRNDVMIKSIVSALAPNDQLCIATNLTSPEELVQTKYIHQWRKDLQPVGKFPTIFVVRRSDPGK